MTSENLLYSTGHSVLCGDRGDRCVCIADSLGCKQKLTQHCEATILQKKKRQALKTTNTFDPSPDFGLMRCVVSSDGYISNTQ